MKDITDTEYTHTKSVCKDFETKNLEEYHNLYVQSNSRADIFEKFRNMYLEMNLTLFGFKLHQD